MAQIGSLSVKLGLVTVDWEKSTAKAKQSAKDLQTQFNELGTRVKGLADDFKKWGIASTTVGMGLLYREAVMLSDEVSDLSKSFGLSVSEVLSFRDALQSSGGKAENADKAINTLFSHIADAKQGNDEAIAQFEKLGISFADLESATPYEVIQKVASGFSNVADQFERTKAVKELFGKAGIGVTMSDLAANMEGGSKKNEKYADSLKKVGEVSDAIKANLQNLTVAFADLIAPLTTGGIVSVDTFSKLLKGLAAAAIPLAIGAIATSVLAVATAFRQVVLAIEAATLAGAAFNLTAGVATPIGLIIRAVAGAAAIGTFLYMTTSSSEPEAATAPGRTASGTVGPAPFDSMKEGEAGKWDSAEQEKAKAADSIKVQQKKSQIELARQLATIEKENADYQLDSGFKRSELDKKIHSINADYQSKMASIDAQERQQLAEKDLSSAYRKTIQDDAAQQRIKANQDAASATEMARKADTIKRTEEVNGLNRAIGLTKELQGFDAERANIERSQIKLQSVKNDLALIEVNRKEAIANIDAKLKESLGGLEPIDPSVRTARENEAASQRARINAKAKQDAETAAFTWVQNYKNQNDESKRMDELAAARLSKEAEFVNLSSEEKQLAMSRFDLEASILEMKFQGSKLGIDPAVIKSYTDAKRAIGNAMITSQQQVQRNALADQVTEEGRINDLLISRIKFEASLIGQTQEQKAAKMSVFDAQAKANEYERRARQLGVNEADIAINKAKILAGQQTAYTAQQGLAINRWQEQNALSIDAIKLANDRARYESTLLTMTDEERGIKMAQYDLEAGIVEFRRQAKELGIPVEDIERFAEALRAVRQQTIDNQNETIASQRTFSYGWEKAFNKYKDDANNAGLSGAQTFQVFTDEIGRSIDELVDKGETSFGRLADAIIKDLTKIYLKKQMMIIADGLTSSAGGFFKNLFSGGISLGGSTPAMPSMSGGYGFGMHATGGNLGANSPSWVGERGPELFMPKQSGMIVPNNAIGDMTNNQPSTVYNGPYIASMNAIDTQSGIQFLSKNKQAIWAANQNAQRSIPMSR